MWRMKKSIRGCISCILPCGALDVIRIVHSNSRVEEITTRTIKAADVMRAILSMSSGTILPPTSSSFLPTLNSVAATSTSSFHCLPLPTNTLQKQIRSSPSPLTQALADPAVLLSGGLISTPFLSLRRHPLTICHRSHVHSNGRIEELTARTIKAADVMRAHPNHIIKKYSSSNLVIVPPKADLHRGNIYLLVTLPPPPPPNQHAAAVHQQLSTSTHTSTSSCLTLSRRGLGTITGNIDELIEER
ncbi:hypothetical protein S83_048364 [Arachis hypogaea]